LQAGYFDTLPASRVAASQNIVNPDHVITGGFEAHAVILIGVPGQGRLLRAANPADLILCRLLTCRAIDVMRLCFSLFVEKILFLQSYSPFAAIPGFVILTGSRSSFSRFGGRTFFDIAIWRTVLPVLYDSLAIAAAAS